MKLKRFKEKDNKRIGIIVFTIVCILLVSGVILYRTFAIFEVKTAQNIIKGKVGDMGDIEFAFYIDGTLSKTMPSDYMNYDLDETQSYCSLGDTKLEDIDIEYNRQDGTVSVQGLASTKTKCYLYLKPYDKEVGMIKYITGKEYNQEIWAHRDSITKIVFEDKLEQKPNSAHSYDISVKNDGSVMAYLMSNGDNTYTCYIQGNKKVKTNTDSQSLFAHFEKVTTFEGMEYLDTSETTYMYNIFRDMKSLTEIDLTHFNTSLVYSMNSMFHGCSNLKTLDLSRFDTRSLKDMSWMFDLNSNLTSIYLGSHFDTSKVTNMMNLFTHDTKLEIIDLGESFDTSNVENMTYMFLDLPSLKYIKYGDKFVRKADSNITDMFDSSSPVNKPTDETWNDVSWP